MLLSSLSQVVRSSAFAYSWPSRLEVAGNHCQGCTNDMHPDMGLASNENKGPIIIFLV